VARLAHEAPCIGAGDLARLPQAAPGVASIDYKDALDEALCFGWVDSLIKRLDDRRFARKFTPRREDSRWSAVNRKRYAELVAAGRLKPPGIARPPSGRGYGPRPKRLEIPSKLPAYMQTALRKHRLRCGDLRFALAKMSLRKPT
jgi:uncharacterized protein YdeI (YjbR/CyaY-like superfamily)